MGQEELVTEKTAEQIATEKAKQEKFDAIKLAAHDTAQALSIQFGVKVHELFVIKDDELIVGYIKEPGMRNKMAAVNLLSREQLDACGELIIRTSLLPEQSDSRLVEGGGDDDVYVSACFACNQFVKFYASEVKKN